jgi:hypothetical protein
MKRLRKFVENGAYGEGPVRAAGFTEAVRNSTPSTLGPNP